MNLLVRRHGLSKLRQRRRQGGERARGGQRSLTENVSKHIRCARMTDGGEAVAILRDNNLADDMIDVELF